MGYNLTNERIQDTYQQILQVSGSTIVDGTGSVAQVSITSASYAVTASYALNGGGGGAVEWVDIQNKPAGLVSSSAQLADDISGSFTSTSASLAADIASNSSDIATKLATSTFTSYSSSVSTRLTTDESNISTNTSDISTNAGNISANGTRIDSLEAATSSYAVKSSNNVFSGTQTFTDVAINGTASIAYLQQITGSAKVIGDAYIILNADSPAQRYAGVKVYDSGSSPVSTGSFQWDSVNNDWFYEYQKDATDYAVALFGPEFATKGTPTYLTSNTIPKATGGHHLGDSIISDDGSTISVGGALSATGNVSAGGDVSADGIVSASGDITASAFNVASGDISFGSTTIKIGNSVAAGAEEVSVGKNISGGNGYAVNIGSNLTNNGTGGVVLIGRGSTAGGDYSIAVGENVTAGGGGIAIGNNISAAGDGLNLGGIIEYDGSSVMDLNASIVSASGNFEVQGQLYSPTFAGSVASSTSSVDFDNGNFATLSLSAATFLANPSNLKSGTTYTIIMTSGSHISGHGTAWKFAGGTAPTYTDGTDVLTCVSDGTNLYATALTDFQ